MKFNWKASLSGACAGIANGLFGAGGGMIFIPMITHFTDIKTKEAFSTAISVMLPLCIVSIIVYGLNGNLPLRESMPYLIGGGIGGLVAGFWMKKISPKLLRKALGVLILWGGIRLLV